MWRGDSCNALNGTDGTIWPAGVNKKDKLYFFIPDICRYMNSHCARLSVACITALGDTVALFARAPPSTSLIVRPIDCIYALISMARCIPAMRPTQSVFVFIIASGCD